MSVSLYVNDEYAQVFQALGFQTYDDVMRHQGEDFAARSHSSSTVRMTAPGGGEYYLKRYWYPRRMWKYVFRRSRVAREVKSLDTLRCTGVSVPELVAWGEERAMRFVKSGFLLTRAVDDAMSLDRFLQRWFALGRTSRQLRPAVARFAREVKRVHKAGYRDGDLFFRNLLVRPATALLGGESSWTDARIFWIDSPKGRKTAEWRANNAANLDLASLEIDASQFLRSAERLFFLQEYNGAPLRSVGDLVWIKQLQALSGTLRQKRLRLLEQRGRRKREWVSH